mmetsp:Transcript_2207/g.7017  ORF Transcript_2207/g.7017 Transcript_2207/m.7017 type:complete len:346 (+) Transcript_2207:92-1129(+)
MILLICGGWGTPSRAVRLTPPSGEWASSDNHSPHVEEFPGDLPLLSVGIPHHTEPPAINRNLCAPIASGLLSGSDDPRTPPQWVESLLPVPVHKHLELNSAHACLYRDVRMEGHLPRWHAACELLPAIPGAGNGELRAAHGPRDGGELAEDAEWLPRDMPASGRVPRHPEFRGPCWEPRFPVGPVPRVGPRDRRAVCGGVVARPPAAVLHDLETDGLRNRSPLERHGPTADGSVDTHRLQPRELRPAIPRSHGVERGLAMRRPRRRSGCLGLCAASLRGMRMGLPQLLHLEARDTQVKATTHVGAAPKLESLHDQVSAEITGKAFVLRTELPQSVSCGAKHCCFL